MFTFIRMQGLYIYIYVYLQLVAEAICREMKTGRTGGSRRVWLNVHASGGSSEALTASRQPSSGPQVSDVLSAFFYHTVIYQSQNASLESPGPGFASISESGRTRRKGPVGGTNFRTVIWLFELLYSSVVGLRDVLLTARAHGVFSPLTGAVFLFP